MSKNKDSKPSKFGLPKFKDEQKELDRDRKFFYDNLSPEMKKKVDDFKKQQGK